jgi:hypothetical protein
MTRLTRLSTIRPALAAGLLIAAASAAQPPALDAQTKATAIRSISTTANGPALVVVIEATGPLPMPTSGVAEGPPRIFFDFPGVALAAPKTTASSDARVLRVRAAVNSASPLVTRIVLDLAAPQPFAIERGPNRVSIVVGLSSPAPPTPTRPSASPTPPATAPTPPPAIPPVPKLPEPPPGATATPGKREPPPVASLPPSPATPAGAPVDPAERPAPKVTVPPVPPARSSSPSSLPVPPAKDLDRYRRQVAPTLDRLRLQEPLLMSLDSAEAQPMDRVQLAVEEFERLRQELAGIKPPDSLRSQHDMLIQATTLALMATRLRIEAFRTSDPATLRNVASAAAGATLLLDRACADLGCPER